MKFKTNAKCGGCSAAIIDKLSNIAPAEYWSVDLSSPDKVLTYSGNDPVDAEAVMQAVRDAGFQIELL